MIAFVFIGNIENCPYFNYYKLIAEDNNVDYRVFYWNRANYSTTLGKKFIAFNLPSKLNKNKFMKVFDFIRYKRWLCSQINKERFDKIVLLDTLSAFLVMGLLIPKAYILEIRDYSYESNKIFKFIEDKLIANAFCTFISSLGFLNFLPRNRQYLLFHNISTSLTTASIGQKKDISKEALNIVWIGSIRYYDTQKSIITLLKNDKRFNIFYHGSGPQLDELRKLCENEGKEYQCIHV